MDPIEIIRQFVQILTGALSSWAQGIGSGIQQAVHSMFFTTVGDAEQLSIYAVMVLIFASLSLAVGLTKLIFNWLSSLGGSN